MPIIVVLLVVIGVAVALTVLAGRNAYERRRDDRERRAQHPDQPWLWRREWADGHIPSRTDVSAGCLWMFGLLWLAMTSPVLLINLPREPDQQIVLTIFRWIFPAAGVGVLLSAAYLTLRKRKYGLSYCRLDAVPARPGRTLRAEVETHVHEPPPAGFLATLSCVQRVTSHGRETRTTESVLWQDDQTVTNATPGIEGGRVPVAFDLPADAEPTDERDPDDAVVWRLDVAASVPGIDYAARFELPVFDTGEHVEVVTARPAHADAAAWSPDAGSPISIGVGPHGGEEIRVAAGRTASDWVSIFVFFAFFAGAVFIFDKLSVPAFVLGFILVIAAFFLVLVLDFLVGRSIVRTETAGLTIRRWLTRNIAAKDIVAIEPGVGFTSGNVVYYDVNVKLTSGKKAQAVRYIRKKRDAEMIAARLRRAVGR